MRVVGAQVTAVQHVVVVFHEGRRAPGAGEQLEPVPARGHRSPNERDPEPQVVRDGEGGQVLVPLVDVRVALAREVTAVDVGPAQGIPDHPVGAVIRLQQLFLSCSGQFREGLGRGIGQRPADSNHGLERFPRIDEDVYLPFGGRLRWLERSEEHTSELQSLAYLVCRLLLEKKKKKNSVLRTNNNK